GQAVRNIGPVAGPADHRSAGHTQEAHVTQGPLTTEAGAPVADNQNSETAGPGGPVLVQDQALLEKLAHFNRERIPERVVHARGSGAYGHFTVTDDVSDLTSAAFLNT
ncbi:hypothetical protein ADL26_19490, partial [Thermoactinomyces vulgaris]